MHVVFFCVGYMLPPFARSVSLWQLVTLPVISGRCPHLLSCWNKSTAVALFSEVGDVGLCTPTADYGSRVRTHPLRR